MSYKDPHDDDYYKKEILLLLADKECIRSQMYKAFGKKIKAEQLTRVLNSLQLEGKISFRHLSHGNKPKAWGLTDHPEQVKHRERQEAYRRWWNERIPYTTFAQEREARRKWLAYLYRVMVQNDPETVYELICSALFRATEPSRLWLHSAPVL